MLDAKLLEKFELIELATNSKGRKETCSINDKKRMFSIPAKFANQLKWKETERVNLYRFGETFMLKPDKVGLINAHKRPSGILVTSRNFCLEILSRTKSCREFTAWVEDDALFFKPMKGEE